MLSNHFTNVFTNPFTNLITNLINNPFNNLRYDHDCKNEVHDIFYSPVGKYEVLGKAG